MTDNMLFVPQRARHEHVGIRHWFFVSAAPTTGFAVVEKAAEQEESFPTKAVMRIMKTSIANTDAGRLSEPVNERARQLLLLLGEDDD